MTTQPTTLQSISAGELDHVIGGGIGAQIGGLFGADGAKWGGIADSIFGLFGGGLGGLGGLAGGGGAAGGLGGLGNLFGGLLKSGGSSSSAPTSGAPQQVAPPTAQPS